MDRQCYSGRMIPDAARLLLAVVLLCVAAEPSTATIIHVPGEQASIQAGLDAASAGDTVVVACGTYYEHSITMKPGVYLTSETGGSECVGIDAQQKGRVLYCGFTDSPTNIVGFTIVGGETSDGGGLYCHSSSLAVTACAFVGNYAFGYGGGLYCPGFSPSLTDCRFEGNQGTAGGGAAYCMMSSSPAFTDCIFINNVSQHGGGLGCRDSSSPTLSGCTFAGNEAILGAGVYCNTGSSPTFTSCTFEGNELHQGEGSGIYCASSSSPTLTACIIAFCLFGDAVYCDDASSVPVLSCCDIYGNIGGDWVGCISSQSGVDGNISEDPEFCDAPNGDFTLDASSFCSAANNPSCGLIGAWGVGCDSPVQRASWGAIKAMYR